METYLILTIAGFLAGGLNAVAGGGTFITFPALVFLGLPPITANATAAVAALPGYLSGAWAFRGSGKAEGSLSLWVIMGIGLVGSLIGALLLLVTSSESFSAIVPWLLLAATLMFAGGPYLIRHFQAKGLPTAGPLLSSVALFVVSIYGGYFNGGLGILLLAVFGLLGHININAMNGLKNLMSAVLSAISAVTFAIAGVVSWPEASVMAVAATAGGFAGGWAARKIPNQNITRIGILLVGAVMTVVFFLR